MFSSDISNKKQRFFYNVGVFIGSNYKNIESLEAIYNIFASYGKSRESEAYNIFKSDLSDCEKIESLIDLIKEC